MTKNNLNLSAPGKTPNSTALDSKNLSYLRRFITEQGKIFSRRITGLSAKEQRQLTKAVKQARILGLLGFTPTPNPGPTRGNS
jgi:small subunit ribosomal protein S18